MSIKIGICSCVSSELENPSCCKHLAELGIEAIQLGLGSQAEGYPLQDPELQQKWLEHSRTYGIKIPSLSITEALFSNLAGAEEAVVDDAVLTALNIARNMGIGILLIPSFRKSFIHTEEELHKTEQKLARYCGLAKDFGITIASEILLSAEEVPAFFAAINDPAFRIYPDSYNFVFFRKEPFAPELEAMLPYCVPEIHLKNGTAEGSGTELLSDGVGDAADCLRVLKKAGFSGTVFLENFYGEEKFNRKGFSWMELAAKDIRYIREILSQE